jgi:hypothetical protein
MHAELRRQLRRRPVATDRRQGHLRLQGAPQHSTLPAHHQNLLIGVSPNGETLPYQAVQVLGSTSDLDREWRRDDGAAMRMGDRGCLSLFGQDPETHRLFAEHVTAEYRVKTEGRGRRVDEWKARPEQPDNHWLDCLVGSAVAASIQNVTLLGAELRAVSRPRLKLSEFRRSRQKA